jgi:UDP-3-O-[3-hydroxymyristoyl] glucosamine N-acyltransferase
MKLSELAQLLGGEVSGYPDIAIRGVAKIEEAEAGDITFLANLKYKKYVKTTRASAIIIGRDVLPDELKERKTPLPLVRVPDPYLSFLKLIDIFHPAPEPLDRGIHPTAIIDASASLAADVAIGAYVVIGKMCNIGKRTTLYCGTVLHKGVEIGDDTIIYPNVTVRESCTIGNRVIIHSGAVIGSDGFGFAATDKGTHEKIPQRGIVEIQDDVEIGANCTIDRATIGRTVIEEGVKLDNLIHVAHNVTVGAHTVIAAQTGISGSTKLGKHCAIGGQVGLTGHITIADRTSIGAQSGVPKSIAEEGKTYFGYPAREIHETWRIEGALRQLPELLFEFRKLLQRVEELEKLLNTRTKQ